MEGNDLITECSQVCNIFNTFFREIGSNIGTIENNDVDTERIIHRYIDHPSIDTISNVTQNVMSEKYEFNFSEVTTSDVLKIMNTLSTKKTAGFDEIPIKILVRYNVNPIGIKTTTPVIK